MYIQDTRIPGKDIHMYRVYHPTIYMYVYIYTNKYTRKPAQQTD